MDDFDALYEQLKELNNNVVELKNEQRLTNIFLKEILKNRLNHSCSDNAPALRIDDSYVIIHPSYDNIFSDILKCSQRSSKTLQVLESDRPGDLAAVITGLKDGDVLLINNNLLLKNPQLQDLIIDADEKQTLSFEIGKGPGARSISLDLPKIIFIIFSDFAELIPERILKSFPIINSYDNDLNI